MALKIIREISLGSGTKIFRFANHEDPTADQQQYEEGCLLEGNRLNEDSFSQQIYERLSSKAA